MASTMLKKAAAVLVALHFAAVLLALSALLVLGERTRPTFFLTYAPEHPFALASVVLVPLALWTRRRWVVSCELAALVLAVFGLMGLRLGVSRAPRAKQLRLLTYNVFYGKLDRPKLWDEIIGANADVIVLQATRSPMLAELRERLPGYTVRNDDEFMLATKLKVREVEAPRVIATDLRASWARYALEGPSGPFQVVNVHPISARSGLFDQQDPRIALEQRERQITSAIDVALRSTEPTLLAGDTNLPWLSRVARRHFSDFQDAFEDVGCGFGYTFPAKIPWMRIDRVLGRPGIRFLSSHVLPRGQSDHRAVVVDFELTAP